MLTPRHPQPKLCSDPVFLDSSDHDSTPATEIECKPIVNNLSDRRPTIPPPSTTDSVPAPAPVPEQTAAPEADIPVEESPSRDTPEQPEPAPAPAADPPADEYKHSGAAGEAEAYWDEGHGHWHYSDDGQEQEMVTVVYDEQTGEIQRAFTDGGEDITHEFEGYGQVQPAGGRQGRGHAQEEQDRIGELEELARTVSPRSTYSRSAP